MMEEKRNVTRTVLDIVLIGLQLVLIPILVSFDTRIRTLETNREGDKQRIENIDKKIDRMLEMQQEMQRQQMDFYKEYAGALDYSKRQLNK